jgi:hypothetical protein
VLQSLKTSNFILLYGENAASIDLQPKNQHEVLDSLHSFLLLHTQQSKLPSTVAEDLFHRLQVESLQPREELDQALGGAARLAQWIWSSDQKLLDSPYANRLEFCSILNAAIRSDDANLLSAAMPLIRAINSLCVVRGARPDKYLKFPPEHQCYRGIGMPDEWLAFFRPGLKFRVPGFFATSFNREVCGISTACASTYTFCLYAQAPDICLFHA